MKTLIAATMAAFLAASAYAHSGGTDSAGCHINHKTGVYHCH